MWSLSGGWRSGLMGELLPTLAAQSIREGLLEFLETTFSLADLPARLAMREFLEHPTEGIFKGPYLRLRLPFRAAPDGWRSALDWHPLDDDSGAFAPYGHQARAFARLSSAGLAPGERPLPTLVTTGTGSGKTEAFLYPILDHVLRAKARGVTGMKALILYPMNALANDQAQRLAELITTLPSLAGVTAGLFTGQDGPKRTKVSAEGLITERSVIRSSPPDILLTNYKMLDQLLLRHADAQIWVKSAHSLQYLVLDEFHTYDGAQGTDVSMLLRRLGLALKAHGAVGERPLGALTPVATSATLGDRADPGAMLAFAETVFGEPFPLDAVITESRVGIDEWVGEGELPAGLEPTDNGEVVAAVNAAVATLGSDPQPAALTAAVLGALYDGDRSSLSDAELVRRHPLTHRLLEACGDATWLGTLAGAVLTGADVAAAEACLAAFAGLLSHLRYVEGRGMPSLEAHLWVRELTRIDREASPAPAFAWSDDGGIPQGADPDDEAEAFSGHAFPAIYCRHCGRSGWGVTLSPANNTDLDTSDADIRRDHASRAGKFRPLLLAAREGDEALRYTGGSAPAVENLRWFHVTQRRILVALPEGQAAQDGSVLPVLTHIDADADDASRSDNCPACGQRDGIRFLGSAIATQLSVTLSTLFGSTNLDPSEKKTLVFTDSVQDAAHRAGFVQARSHSLTVRSVLREAVGSEARPLDTLADRVIERAGDDRELRYRILPPDLAEKREFRSFWEARTLAKVSQTVRGRVRRRLAFDATLEFGLQSRLGRTLELTGTLAAHVEAPRGAMLAAARQTLAEAGGQLPLGDGAPDDELVAWARGVLEHMRERGAIEHQWLRKMIEEDGNRHFLWRGRPRSDGMPAFPIGRTAPAFPRVGPPPSGRENVLDPVAGAQSWYAQWAARVLHVSGAEGGVLARLLLKRLAAADVLTVTTNKTGAEVYGIPPGSVIIEPVPEAALVGGQRLLRCPVCQGEVPGTAVVVDQLDGAPCAVTRCDGRLERAPGEPANFYRRFFSSHEVQRVIAREHTGLLEPAVRIAYENGFKGKANAPDAPNVLVATPTLEMGIDIGDLSTVMLASLPRRVASYLQRVGRAGRLTGSALNLAFVSGRGDQLPQLGEPTSMINGRVRPPATYVDAEEILRRQYVASLGDVEARTADGVHPERATGAIGTVDPGSYLYALATRAETDPAHLDAFLSGFPTLSATARASLRAWGTPVAGELTSPLAERMLAESQRWREEIETLGYRIAAIEAALPGLTALAELPVATDDDKYAARSALASLRLARGQRADLQGEYWIGVLERAGIFPNYTLLDDGVTLDVGLSWPDPDSGVYETQSFAYRRNASLALREFAPGATFYAGGHQVRINAIDLGNKGEAVRAWAFCAACGYSSDVTETAPPTACPRCASPAIADVSQRLDVVEMTRVSSTMRRDEATIDDARDDRIRERFQQVVIADLTPDDITSQWYIENYGFGARHVKNLRLRWLNVGRAAGLGATRLIAGNEVNAELFRVCSECGQLDGKSGSNPKYEHRPWCSLRDAAEEVTRSIALGRTLRTEGLLLRLPPMTALGSGFALPSLAAAIKLGLREHIGGAPDHLALALVADPAGGTAAGDCDALLLHDLVPGGTGYLAELADSSTLRAILLGAYKVVCECDCVDSGRLACHRCLLPFAGWGQVHLVSRTEAEKQLREILLAGADGEIGPDGGPPWKITEVQPIPFDPESKMEQKFRASLLQRLHVLGVTVKATPQTVGDRWDIIAGGGRTWTLEPQVLIGGCKPDFVLRCSDPSVPPMAIFCDGKRYHASSLHNRLADDAVKRADLRELGLAVLAFVWADLDEAEPNDPEWFDPAAVPIVMGQPGMNLKPAQVELMRRGPLDLLVSWIQSPDPDGLREVGRALPFFLAKRAQQMGAIDGETGLATTARGLLSGAPFPSAGSPSWAWRQGALVAVARVIPGTMDAEVAVVLDDSATAIGDGITDSWRTWLHLSNLLGLRLTGTRLTVTSLVTDGPAPAAPLDAIPTIGDDDPLQRAWKEILDQATEEEESFLALCAQHRLPVPEYGPEVSGIPLGASWLERRVTVDVDLQDGERSELAALGWTIVRMNLDELRRALATPASGVA
jgi:ATP-dependent helicase YprA (DUF1998 family)